MIRTPHDRGVVVLIDDRFARAEVRRLLPGWWGMGNETAAPESEPVAVEAVS